MREKHMAETALWLSSMREADAMLAQREKQP